MPENFNPADHLLDVVSVDHREEAAKLSSEARLAKVPSLWRIPMENPYCSCELTMAYSCNPYGESLLQL